MNANAAAQLIQQHWHAGTRMASLPDAMRPRSRAEAYAIQARFETLCPAPLYGWKIAATSIAGQRHIGVDGPLAGRILAERVIAEADTIPFGANHMRVAEAEFAFRLASDIAPRVTPYAISDCLDAVATLHPAIEIPDSRFADFATSGAEQLIADLACGHSVVLGDPAPDLWRTLDLAAHKVTATVSGGTPQHGIGANVLSDPRIALAWLINEITGLGLTLRAGQVITTGTCVTPLPIAPHDTVSADFGTIGRITVRFGA